MPSTFVYYHVELDDQSLILTEGVAAETFVDNVSRQAFDNYDECQARFGRKERITELALPQEKSWRQLPHRIRERIILRAEALGFGLLRKAA